MSDELMVVLAWLNTVVSFAYAVIAKDIPRANWHLLWAVALLVVTQ